MVNFEGTEGRKLLSVKARVVWFIPPNIPVLLPVSFSSSEIPLVSASEVNSFCLR